MSASMPALEPITLTRARLRKTCCIGRVADHEATGRYAGLGENIPLVLILDVGGMGDALWALRALPEDSPVPRLLACDYAEHVLPPWEKERPTDDRPRRAIEVARQFICGRATRQELAAAWAAVRDATGYTERAAERAAAGAAAGAAVRDAAGYTERAAVRAAAGAAAGAATGYSAWAAERAWQCDRLRWYAEGNLPQGYLHHRRERIHAVA